MRKERLRHRFICRGQGAEKRPDAQLGAGWEGAGQTQKLVAAETQGQTAAGQGREEGESQSRLELSRGWMRKTVSSVGISTKEKVRRETDVRS